MNDMHSWSTASSLIINAEKTTTMSFHTWRGGLVKLKIICDNIDFAYKARNNFRHVQYISENMK
jgi:hypothetical protein